MQYISLQERSLFVYTLYVRPVGMRKNVKAYQT